MDDLYTYQIQVDGQVNAADLNATSPLHLVIDRADAAGTLFHVHTDQSGVVGLIRHLHSLGFVLLSIARCSP